MADSEGKQHARILAAIQSELWAITSESLRQIVSIAQGLNESPQAVAAALGRPLDNTRTVSERDGVAIVPVTGPIFRYANLFTAISGATSVEQLALDFNAALNNPAISAIVLEIDSPGGQIAGIAETAQMIRAANKPVTAYVSHLGASAGYWLASAADTVVVADTAILGSIGAVMRVSVKKDDGSMAIVSSQSPDKRVDASTDEGRAKYQALMDAQGQVFIEAVAHYRDVSTDTVLSDFGRGGLFVGQQAVDAGLADRRGSLESVIAELSNQSKNQIIKPRGGLMATNSNNEITRDAIVANHPAIAESLRAEGYAAGQTAGAQAERERILAVEAQAMPGHEKLIAQLKADGKTSGADAAVQVLAAEKQKLGAMAANLRADAGAPLPHAATPANDGREQPAADGQQAQGSWGDAFAGPAGFGAFAAAGTNKK